MKKLLLFFLTTLLLISCSSNDQISDINGIVITEDSECCSAEEAFLVYKFLETQKEIPSLTVTVSDKYFVHIYTQTGSFHVGYNEVYFVVTKKSSGNYVKDFEITDVTPLMLMSSMAMKHSTPVGATVESFNEQYAAVKRGWISFVMASSESDNWSLTFNTRVVGIAGQLEETPIQVSALTGSQQWITSFKYNEKNYFISLVNPDQWKIGANTITAYISEKSSPITSPYQLASEEFSIDFTPTMPDMGGHSSPDNKPLTLQPDGSYQGIINLTMTGYWQLALTVRDAQGNVVATDLNLFVNV